MKRPVFLLIAAALSAPATTFADPSKCVNTLNGLTHLETESTEGNINLDKVYNVLEHSRERLASISGKAGEFHKKYLVLSQKTDSRSIKSTAEKFESLLKGYENHVAKSENWLAKVFGRSIYLARLEKGQGEREQEIIKCSSEISCRVKEYRTGLIELGVLGDEISSYLSQLQEQEANVSATSRAFQTEFLAAKSLARTSAEGSTLKLLATGEVLKVELQEALVEIQAQSQLLSDIRDAITLKIGEFSDEMAELNEIIRDQTKSVREKSVQLPLMNPRLETEGFLVNVTRALAGEKLVGINSAQAISSGNRTELPKLGDFSSRMGEGLGNEIALKKIESYFQSLHNSFNGYYVKFWLRDLGILYKSGAADKMNLIGPQKISEHAWILWHRLSNKNSGYGMEFFNGTNRDEKDMEEIALTELINKMNGDLVAVGSELRLTPEMVFRRNGPQYATSIEGKMEFKVSILDFGIWALLYYFPMQNLDVEKYSRIRSYMVDTYSAKNTMDELSTELLPVLLARLDTYTTPKVLEKFKKRNK